MYINFFDNTIGCVITYGLAQTHNSVISIQDLRIGGH